MKDLSLHLMDIIRNSVDADAKNIEVDIETDTQKDMLIITIKDDGKGMSQALAEKVANPFYTTRTTRKVGLGIPLLAETCNRSRGELRIKSELGKGTEIEAILKISSIDRPPIGDIANTIVSLQAADTQINYVVEFRNQGKKYTYSTIEIRNVLGNKLDIDNPRVLAWIGDNIADGLKEIFGGVLNEIPCGT